MVEQLTVNAPVSIATNDFGVQSMLTQELVNTQQGVLQNTSTVLHNAVLTDVDLQSALAQQGIQVEVNPNQVSMEYLFYLQIHD